MDLLFGPIIFLSFYLVGDKLREGWGFAPSIDVEAVLFSTVLGLVAISLAVTLLAICGLVYPAAAWLLLGGIFLVRASRVRQLSTTLLGKLRSPTPPSPDKKTPFEIFTYGVLAVLVLMACTQALAPPTATDALVYHLAAPKVYLEHHSIINLPNNIYSFFPLQFEMIYLFCLMLTGDALAQLAGLGMTLLLLLAMTLFYKRYLTPHYAALIPVVFFATPTVWSISSAAYVDVAAAGFIFLAFYSWTRWRMTQHNGWFLSLITFAACATATKLTAFIILPLVLLGIALYGRENASTSGTLRRIGLFILALVVFGLTWMARNFHFTGNPFAPFLMQYFNGGGINWDEHRSYLQFQYYRSFGMGYGLKDFLLLPINLTFFSEKDSLRFDGEIGMVYFLLLPGLFWLKQAKSASSLAGLGFLFVVLSVSWFTQSQYIRLLIPALVFLTLIAVWGFATMMRSDLGKPVKGAIHGLLAVGILYNTNGIMREWIDKQPLKIIAAMESRDEYLARTIPSYTLFQTVNNTLTEEDTLLFVYMRNLGYLCNRKFISDTFFEAHTLKQAIRKEPSIEGVARQLAHLGVTHLLFDNRFVFGKDSAFSLDDLIVLKPFLDDRATLVKEKNGYYLYRLKL